mmetsp:Transcript_27985/g.71208  ORF Transcript_27985/g.71208 Transcript_27985/m.71208 type:complete len:173 (+) Transcript_27985:208-726(+)
MKIKGFLSLKEKEGSLDVKNGKLSCVGRPPEKRQDIPVLHHDEVVGLLPITQAKAEAQETVGAEDSGGTILAPAFPLARFVRSIFITSLPLLPLYALGAHPVFLTSLPLFSLSTLSSPFGETRVWDSPCLSSLEAHRALPQPPPPLPAVMKTGSPWTTKSRPDYQRSVAMSG